MTRTTDFPSWFWLPLRDDCEWDSIFNIHECYDKEYDNVLLALIGVLLRTFLTTPFPFWAFMVFHFSRQLSHRLLLLILALSIITAVPVWLLPTICSDGYERHRDMVESAVFTIREIWVLLALPNIFFCPPSVTLWLRQSIAKMQEAIVGMGDYVSNSFNFDISFPVSQGRDLTPRNDEDSGAERWMKLLLQEAADERQAKRDEEARVLEQENNSKQAALLKKQEFDWMLDVASKALTLRSQRQRSQRARRDPPPPQGEGHNSRRLSVAALKLRDEGINIPVYRTKSTQTEDVDLVARRKATKPLNPAPRQYVHRGVQTEPVESPTREEPKVTISPVTPQEVSPSLTTTSPVEENPATPIQEEPKGITNTLPDTTIPASPIHEEPSSLNETDRLSPSPPANHASLKQEESHDLSNADCSSPPAIVLSTQDEPNGLINTDNPPISPPATVFPAQEESNGLSKTDRLPLSPPANFASLTREEPHGLIDADCPAPPATTFPTQDEPYGLINTNYPPLSPSANHAPSANIDAALDNIIEGSAQSFTEGCEPEDDIYEDSLAGDHDMPDGESDGPEVSQESHSQMVVACDTDEEMLDQGFSGSEELTMNDQQEEVEDQEASVNDIEMGESSAVYPTQEEQERIKDAALDVFAELMDEDDDQVSGRPEPSSTTAFDRMRDRSLSPRIERPRSIQIPPITGSQLQFSLSEEPTEPATTTLGIQFPPYSFARPGPPPLPATASPGTQFPSYHSAQTLHTSQDVQAQAPFTQDNPFQHHAMSQDEQDDLARLMEAEFEMQDVHGTNTQTIQDSQPQQTQSPRLSSHPSIPIDPELANEVQALVDAANAPPPLPTNPFETYTQTNDGAQRTRYAPDPAKVATKEKLASRRIAKPRTRRPVLTPAQQNFPQSSVPSENPQQQPPLQSEDTQAKGIAIMDSEALGILQLAMMNDIPIAGHVQTRGATPSTQETTTQEAIVQEEIIHGEIPQENKNHENTANESLVTEQPEVVQPVTPEVPPQQTETHVATSQPAPFQQQISTSSTSPEAGLTQAQQQQPVAPIQMGGLILPGGNAVISNPTTIPLPQTPQTPQTPQHAGKAPLSEEEKQKRKNEQIERAKKAREARKKAGPSLFHQPRRGGTPGPSTPRTPRTPTTPRQNPAGSQPGSDKAEAEGLKILEAGDIPVHLREQVRHDKD